MAVIGPLTGDDRGAQVGDELAQVASLVSRVNDLAVVITDVGVPAGVRVAILKDLLESRVDEETLRIASRAVATEAADEVLPVLGELADLIRHACEIGTVELEASETVLSRTGWRSYASGFAAAVLEGETTDQLAEVEDELFRFTRIVESNPALRSALADPGRPLEDRRGLLFSLIESKVRPATALLAGVVLVGRTRDLVAGLDWIVEQVASTRGWRVAKVRSARTLDADDARELSQSMEHLAGQPVELQVSVEPDLIGGAVVQIGDLLVDASVRHRLDQIEEHLLGSEETMRGAMS